MLRSEDEHVRLSIIAKNKCVLELVRNCVSDAISIRVTRTAVRVFPGRMLASCRVIAPFLAEPWGDHSDLSNQG